MSEPGFVGFKDVLDVGTSLSPVRHGEERSHLRTVSVMDGIFCLNHDSFDLADCVDFIWDTILGFDRIEGDSSTLHHVTIQPNHQNQLNHTNQRSKKKRSVSKRF